MYIDRDIVYADANKYLVCNNKVGFELPIDENIVEKTLNINDLFIDGKFARYNNGEFIQKLNPSWTYGDYKRDIIKKRYSNDDQIAIILNKDDSSKDVIRYKKMMEWRVFASNLANKIIEQLK